LFKNFLFGKGRRRRVRGEPVAQKSLQCFVVLSFTKFYVSKNHLKKTAYTGGSNVDFYFIV
jgi:hypothetical protein